MLNLVPTPLGNPADFSLRALDVLRQSDLIILEEYKESSVWLRAHGIAGRSMEQLNEHSKPEDIKRLAELCREKNVALITDCGTPGFADPGADLVRACREHGIPVKALPGPSSLMTLLSLSSQRLDQFVFRGFVPAETEARKKSLRDLQTEKRAIILMDTPYRLIKMMDEMIEFFPQRKLLLALDMTQESELILEGKAASVRSQILKTKAEFMLLLYPV